MGKFRLHGNLHFVGGFRGLYLKQKPFMPNNTFSKWAQNGGLIRWQSAEREQICVWGYCHQNKAEDATQRNHVTSGPHILQTICVVTYHFQHIFDVHWFWVSSLVFVKLHSIYSGEWSVEQCWDWWVLWWPGLMRLYLALLSNGC